MTAMVRIEWYCGMNVPGTGGFFTEPDECGTEFEEVIPAVTGSWEIVPVDLRLA